MSARASALAQSESKARLFERLHLNENEKMHRFLYSLMKAEAVQAWTRMTGNRNCLAREFRDDSSIKPPFTFGHMDEVAIRREIAYIYQTARPDTKIMYALGRDSSGDPACNWIIRWLLWHVFRYRDDRNVTVSKRGVSAASSPTELEDNPQILLVPDTVYGQSIVQAARAASQQAIRLRASGTAVPANVDPRAAERYDPVRDAFR